MEERILTTEEIQKLNKIADEMITQFYQKHDADSFFCIDDILKVCRKQGLTTEQVPRLIEMQNILVLG